MSERADLVVRGQVVAAAERDRIATVDAIVSGLAPARLADTEIVG